MGDDFADHGIHIPGAEHSTYPVREGCFVQPIIDGLPAFRRICEAIESATTRVWGTVAFLTHRARMPDGRGDLFDVLDAAVQRGVDVRAIFWRSESTPLEEHFGGSPIQRSWLAERGSAFAARWDALPGGGCQHQKTWLIDAGSSDEVAFIGGINIDEESVVSQPGHPPTHYGNVHDMYVEVRGPAVSDVHHNFVQRWNEASERVRPDGFWPPGADRGDLPFPSGLSSEAGTVRMQITRTVQPERYTDFTAAPEAATFAVADGERSVYEQYITAIDSAMTAIYIEDQLVASPKVEHHLLDALDRGVLVVMVVPGECHDVFGAARKHPDRAAFFAHLASFDEKDGFTMAALAASRGGGEYDEVYVHAKVMLVDDVWATIGSTNTATQSFKLDTELNASFWDDEAVTALRCDLFGEHLDVDTSALGIRDAMRLFGRRARDNANRKAAGAPLDGLVYRIEAGTYGLGVAKTWPIPDPLHHSR